MSFIAEIGSNFEGSLTRAKEMIHAAQEAGATIAKFQLFKPEQYPHNIALPEEWIPELEAEANKIGIGFLLSVFYPTSFSLPTVKIAFSQRHNFRLIEHYKSSRLIVSGNYFSFWPNGSLRLLCVPKYPAQKEDYKEILDFYDGISDHTEGIGFLCENKPRIFEKHFKLGDEKISPDAGSFASTPKEFKELTECLWK